MGLTQDILREPVASVPISPGVMLDGSVRVRDAIAAMRNHQQGCVVVVDSHGRPEGKFTEHQIARLMTQRPGFLNEPVRSFIREAWSQMRQSESIANLIHKLQTYRQRHVIVVDDDGRAIGVVGQKGLMEYLTEQFPRLVKVQQMETKVAMEAREGA